MQLFQDTGQIANLKRSRGPDNVTHANEGKTNVRFSVHECVIETWHVQCSKNSKHTLFPFKADVATRTF